VADECSHLRQGAVERLYPASMQSSMAAKAAWNTTFVAPGASPSRSGLQVDGGSFQFIRSPTATWCCDPNREELRQQRPTVYQTISGARHEARDAFVIRATTRSDRGGCIRPQTTVVIDPTPGLFRPSSPGFLQRSSRRKRSDGTTISTPQDLLTTAFPQEPDPGKPTKRRRLRHQVCGQR